MKAKYSIMEQRLLSLLRDQRLTSAELVKKHYRRRKPLNAQATIVSVMRGLSRKVQQNAEPFTILKSKRRGPHPIEFWKEKRNGNQGS